MKKLSILIFILLLFSIANIAIAADDFTQQRPIDIVYFYGDGCPHCAKLEAFLEEIKPNYNLNIVSYEVYSNQTNRDLAEKMAVEYKETFRGVPMTFIGDEIFIGFSDAIGKQIESKIKQCELACCDSPLDKVKVCQQQDTKKEALTILSVMALAFADSINPCAFAILLMVLVALFAQDPTKKKNILLGGLAFCLSIFITYLIYGLIIIQLFKFAKDYFTAAAPYINGALAVFAIILGLVNIKDYIKYKSGTFGTEMPMSMRPIAKSVISAITKPVGAFIIGVFVSLFLLPCSIGPYIVAGQRLSELSFFSIAPWLIFYNIIFILPMVAITLLVYWGYSTVNNISGWKESHVRMMHLISGLTLVIMGIGVLLGWF